MSSSARVPFVPSSRPASRAAHLKDQVQNSAKPQANPQFLADIANPLHMSSNAQPASAKAQSRSQNTANRVSQSDNITDKPLNIGGLLKKKNLQTAPGPPQGPGLSRRPSFPGADAMMRPSTADPHARTHDQFGQALKIAAPVPRQAPRPSSPTVSNNLASGVFSFALLAPESPPPSKVDPQSTPESTQHPNEMHTPASGLGFSLSKPHTASEQQQNRLQQLPSPPNTIRIANTSVFESHSTVEHPTPLLPFTLNMSLPNLTGPQRVLLNPDTTRSILDNPPLDQGPNEDDTKNRLRGHRKKANEDQQQLKRPRAELEHDQHSQEGKADHNGHLKRYKNCTVRILFMVFLSSCMELSSSPLQEGYGLGPQSPHEPSSPAVTRSMATSMPTEYRRHHDNQQHRSHTPLTPPQDRGQGQGRNQHQEHYQDQDVSMLDGDIDGSKTLDKLLGCDTDAYIEEHMEKYERAVNRWRECSMEEWIAGADGAS
jgi:hypothetical protein